MNVGEIIKRLHELDKNAIVVVTDPVDGGSEESEVVDIVEGWIRWRGVVVDFSERK